MTCTCYSGELTHMILAVYREGDLVTITDRNDLHVLQWGAYTHDTGCLQGRRLGDHHRQE